MTLRPVALMLILCTSASAGGLSTRLSQVSPARFPSLGVTLGVFTEEGSPVPGLTRDAFSLDEDGTRVAVKSVEVEKAPLSIGLVLDLSGSMKPALEDLKAAVVGFVRELEPGDRVMLLTFSDKPRLREDLTANRSVIQEKVEKLETEGATALYDAMSEAVAQLRRVEGRRLVIQDEFGVVHQDLDVELPRAKSIQVHASERTAHLNRAPFVRLHAGGDPPPPVPIARSGEVDTPVAPGPRHRPRRGPAR